MTLCLNVWGPPVSCKSVPKTDHRSRNQCQYVVTNVVLKIFVVCDKTPRLQRTFQSPKIVHFWPDWFLMLILGIFLNMIVGVTVYRIEISTYSKQAYCVTYRVVYMHANYLQSLGSLLVNLLTFYTKLLNIYKKF